MPFFKKIPKSKVVAVIDITSSSVGGALVESNEGCPIILLAVPKSPLNFLLDVSLEASLRCTADALHLTAKKLKSLYSGRIDEILCVFSSPWFASKTKIITLAKEKPFEIKNDFFSQLIEEEERNFAPPKTGEAGRSEKNGLFIEHEVVKTELNGYFTKSPVGKTVKSVKAYIYLSAGVGKAMEMAEREIAKFFIHTPLRFTTSSFVVFKVLNDIINSKEGFLIIDIGGETTEIILIRDNTLEQSVSFPRGTNLLFKKTAAALNTFLRETPSIVKAYSIGHRTSESSEKIAEAIKNSVGEWRGYLKSSLAAMSREKLLPQNIFVIGDDPVCKFFSSCLDNNDLSEFAILRKPFVAQKINPVWLARYFNPNSPNKDILLMIEAVYANKFLDFRF